MNYWIILVAIIVVVLLLYIIIVNVITNTIHYTIDGCWIAEPAFLEEAGVDKMCIFFDIEKKSMYIIIADGEDIKMCDKFDCKISSKFFKNLSPKVNATRYFTIKIDDLPDDFKEIFPEKQTIRIDGGTMRMHGEDMTFKGYKCADISEKINICD